MQDIFEEKQSDALYSDYFKPNKPKSFLSKSNKWKKELAIAFLAIISVHIFMNIACYIALLIHINVEEIRGNSDNGFTNTSIIHLTGNLNIAWILHVILSILLFIVTTMMFAPCLLLSYDGTIKWHITTMFVFIYYSVFLSILVLDFMMNQGQIPKTNIDVLKKRSTTTFSCFSAVFCCFFIGSIILLNMKIKELKKPTF